MNKDGPALALYRDNRSALVDYARSILGNPAQAEDVVQEAWLHFDRASDTAIREPLGYLHRIVRNLAIDVLRRSAREHSRILIDEDVALTVMDDTPSAETALIARDSVRIVSETIAALPERQRIAIEMYRFGGFKLREIAQRLNVSIPLVHRLIADGLAECDRRCNQDF